MSEEIKPCPFCEGDKSKMEVWGFVNIPNLYNVVCNREISCGATYPLRRTREEAIEAHNKAWERKG